ncbi:MAG: endonuclease III domain-containing protein [Candidatus Omnitrophota bacterium]|nr:endonuclease III domain-containing protein [Candidatus Omnitrophota bacterium]
MQDLLLKIYKALFKSFGPQNWWPAKTKFEVIAGAILTQNTAWSNVEKAISSLRSAGVLSQKKLRVMPVNRLAKLIKPAGYYNIKAERLKNFVNFLFREYQGSIKKMFAIPAGRLRQELLKINGVGNETADSIILYAAEKPVFVVDAYTRRILLRHQIIPQEYKYGQIQSIFEKNLPKDHLLYNEFHALIVKLGKDYCRKKPQCKLCPLAGLIHK